MQMDVPVETNFISSFPASVNKLVRNIKDISKINIRENDLSIISKIVMNQASRDKGLQHYYIFPRLYQFLRGHQTSVIW